MLNRINNKKMPFLVSIDEGLGGSIVFLDVGVLLEPRTAQKIRNFRREKRLSKSEVSSRSGVDIDTVDLAERQPAKIAIGDLNRICKALGRCATELNNCRSFNYENGVS
jgi:DNA-binding Xre family transcriptional regulator